MAVLARRLGVEAWLLGCVGEDDLAEQALAGPSREGVDLRLVRRAAGPTRFGCVAAAPGGDKTIVLALNANEAWSKDTDRLEREVAEAAAGSVLVANLQVPPVLVTTAARAARRAASRKTAGMCIQCGVRFVGPGDRCPRCRKELRQRQRRKLHR